MMRIGRPTKSEGTSARDDALGSSSSAAPLFPSDTSHPVPPITTPQGISALVDLPELRDPHPLHAKSPLLSLSNDLLRQIICSLSELSAISRTCKQMEEACRPVLWSSLIIPLKTPVAWRGDFRFYQSLVEEMRGVRREDGGTSVSRMIHTRRLSITLSRMMLQSQDISMDTFSETAMDVSSAPIGTKKCWMCCERLVARHSRAMIVLCGVGPNIIRMTLETSCISREKFAIFLYGLAAATNQGECVFPNLRYLQTDSVELLKVLLRSSPDLSHLTLTLCGVAQSCSRNTCDCTWHSRCCRCGDKLDHPCLPLAPGLPPLNNLIRLNFEGDSRTSDRRYIPNHLNDILAATTQLRHLQFAKDWCQDSGPPLKFLSLLTRLEVLDIGESRRSSSHWEMIAKSSSLRVLLYDEGWESEDSFYDRLDPRLRSSTVERIIMCDHGRSWSWRARNGMPIDAVEFDIHRTQPISHRTIKILDANPRLTEILCHPGTLSSDADISRAKLCLDEDDLIAGTIVRTYTRGDCRFTHVRTIASTVFVSGSEVDRIRGTISIPRYYDDGSGGEEILGGLIVVFQQGTQTFRHMYVGDSLRWNDSTDYQGRLVPMDVLERVYNEVGEGSNWETGGRNMEMPDAAWEVLRLYEEDCCLGVGC